MSEFDDLAADQAAIDATLARIRDLFAGRVSAGIPIGTVPEAFRVVPEPPVLTAALILAGYRQWWEQPPLVPPLWHYGSS